MSETYNVYCDESCHLENDGHKAMVLGATWCPLEKTKEIAVHIRGIKRKHRLPETFEVKWTKVSPAKIDLYLDLIDYFFEEDDLHFRGLIIPDKALLRHNLIPGQDHDTWYYKMYFDMLKAIFSPDSRYRVYLDIKDTRGAKKASKLHDVLCNNLYDFSREVVERLQLAHSHEIEQLQLADLIIGAVSYLNRELGSSEAKNILIKRIQDRSGYSLTKTTLLREEKMNIFRWQASELQG